MKFLDGNNIIRSIFVKNKLINLIIKWKINQYY
jgi:hypothetical protein